MTEPGQDLGHALGHAAGRQGGTVDHHDGQAQRPRRLQLGAGAVAARVLGDDDIDAMLDHQGAVVLGREGPPSQDHDGVGQGQGAVGAIDQPKQVMVPGMPREIRQMLAPDRQKHPASRRAEGQRRAGHVGDVMPAVARAGTPWRPLEGDQGQARARRGGDRIRAHAGGEGMGGVDQMADALAMQIIDEAVHPAEAADARGQGLRHRRLGPPGIGIAAVDPGFRQRAGEAAGVLRAAEDEGTDHV